MPTVRVRGSVATKAPKLAGTNVTVDAEELVPVCLERFGINFGHVC
jgi:hypothetical protein